MEDILKACVIDDNACSDSPHRRRCPSGFVNHSSRASRLPPISVTSHPPMPLIPDSPDGGSFCPALGNVPSSADSLAFLPVVSMPILASHGPAPHPNLLPARGEKGRRRALIRVLHCAFGFDELLLVGVVVLDGRPAGRPIARRARRASCRTPFGASLTSNSPGARSAKQTPSSLIPRSAGAGERVANEAIDQLGIADADGLHDLGVHADVGEARQRVDFIDEELAILA